MLRRLLWVAVLVLIAVYTGWNLGTSMPVVYAQQQQAQPVSAPDASIPVIKAETRLVLVDTVVTDKKGNYIGDLAQKDFRVWEDGKEQTVKSFSFEAGGSDPAHNPKR